MSAGSPDRGNADPRLAEALAGGDPAQIAAALVDARLLVGVVALPGEHAASEGEMALALLESSSGARALPAFTSMQALARWREDARPVPRTAVELAAAVRSEGLATLVVDVAGPVPWSLTQAEVDALAAGYVPAGTGLAAKRVEPVLAGPSWEASAELVEACRGLEVYALDLEVPGAAAPVRGPALGLVPPSGSPPAPLAERLLTAADRELDLLLLDPARRDEAARVGRRIG